MEKGRTDDKSKTDNHTRAWVIWWICGRFSGLFVQSSVTARSWKMSRWDRFIYLNSEQWWWSVSGRIFRDMSRYVSRTPQKHRRKGQEKWNCTRNCYFIILHRNMEWCWVTQSYSSVWCTLYVEHDAYGSTQTHSPLKLYVYCFRIEPSTGFRYNRTGMK